MKLSWYIIEVACSQYYRPDLSHDSDNHSNFLCIAGSYYSESNFKLRNLNNTMRHVINANMNGWGALVNHLSIDLGVSRGDLTARYDWFLNLACKLENEGQ